MVASGVHQAKHSILCQYYSDISSCHHGYGACVLGCQGFSRDMGCSYPKALAACLVYTYCFEDTLNYSGGVVHINCGWFRAHLIERGIQNFSGHIHLLHRQVPAVLQLWYSLGSLPHRCRLKSIWSHRWHKGEFILLDFLQGSVAMVWISSPLVLVAVLYARGRSLGLSHSKGLKLRWAPGKLQLSETICRTSLSESGVEETPQCYLLCVHLWTAVPSKVSRRPQPYQYCSLKMSSSVRNVSEQRSLGLILEAMRHSQMEGWKGKLSLLPTAWWVQFQAYPALSVTSTNWTSAIFPPTQSLTYHVYSLGLKSRVEGRASHHKYSRKQHAVISYHAINNLALQLPTVSLWSYLESQRSFSLVFKACL